MNQPERDINSLVTWTQVIYALHAFSLLTGILGVATVIGAFLTGWPSIIAVILNYLKRGDARIELVPDENTQVLSGDLLVAIGDRESLAKIAQLAACP